MLPDRVSNPGPPTYESGALPIRPGLNYLELSLTTPLSSVRITVGMHSVNRSGIFQGPIKCLFR